MGPVFSPRSSVNSEPVDRKATWPKALRELALALLTILTIRWALFEPYVIPSGSMLPTLLINDHIFVNKFAYGLRLPFSSQYIWRWSDPRRGDVIVFRSVSDPDTFLVKRLIGLPNDQVEMKENGDLYINGSRLETTALTETEKAEFKEFVEKQSLVWEDHGQRKDIRMLENFDSGRSFSATVPADHLLMLGDNRDHSADGRFWGMLPFSNVLGRASLIWLSCEKMMVEPSRLCDFSTLRANRIMKVIN